MTTEERRLMIDLKEALKWCMGVYDFDNSPIVEKRFLHLIEKATELTDEGYPWYEIKDCP